MKKNLKKLFRRCLIPIVVLMVIIGEIFKAVGELIDDGVERIIES